MWLRESKVWGEPRAGLDLGVGVTVQFNVWVGGGGEVGPTLPQGCLFSSFTRSSVRAADDQMTNQHSLLNMQKYAEDGGDGGSLTIALGEVEKDGV